MSRPEHIAPPEMFYNAEESRKYTANTRIIQIQSDMTYRALELLNVPEDTPLFLLDIGCGSGLSGEVLEDNGHVWVGVDVSSDMLDVALERGIEGDLMCGDIGQGFGFRAGSFDGAISISVIQWLCNADKSSHEPRKRLTRFFTTLYSALARGARAIFQFYPENAEQIDMIVSSSVKAGFCGGLVVDYPNSTKAKKYFLCLFAGYANDTPSKQPKAPQGLTDENEVAYSSTRTRDKRSGKRDRNGVTDKVFVMKKKELNRKRGKDTPLDSKFTARKRKPRF